MITDLTDNSTIRVYLQDREHIITVGTIKRDYKELMLKGDGKVWGISYYKNRHKSKFVKLILFALRLDKALNWEIHENKRPKIVQHKLLNCGNCKYFVVDETIDPNCHFGFCDVTDEEVEQIVCEDEILTIGDFCSRFKEKS